MYIVVNSLSYRLYTTLNNTDKLNVTDINKQITTKLKYTYISYLESKEHNEVVVNNKYNEKYQLYTYYLVTL